MKRERLFAASVMLAVGALAGCNGSDSAPVVSGGPTAAVTDDQRTPQSDALTTTEAAQVNQANAEPEPPQKPDM